MSPSPRLLLTIDYESWFAPSRKYDFLSPQERRTLDDGFANDALDPILEKLKDVQASFYLVGELVEWYPSLPQKIADAGHEVGFHCQVHRPLTVLEDIEHDLHSSAAWRNQYKVRGFRAPMIKTIEDVYPLLEKNNFGYSSSLYAPAGTLLQKGNIWELPVSTYPLFGRPAQFQAPRNMNLPLVMGGEFPYGSSMMSGLFPRMVFKIIEKQLKAGLSPVIFLHPYEIVSPKKWPAEFMRGLSVNPLLYVFILDKSAFLHDLLRSFPISTIDQFIKESTQ
ncbi:MAG: polysaccharide deacetylase family protein [Anaerolineales bacterium]|nr:polysaccharide deacetylase family protein [Anaerolineales bacterium]